MLNLIQTIAIRLRTREEGQTFVEYALVIGVVSLALLAVFTTGAGNTLTGALQGAVDAIAEEIGVAVEE